MLPPLTPFVVQLLNSITVISGGRTTQHYNVGGYVEITVNGVPVTERNPTTGLEVPSLVPADKVDAQLAAFCGPGFSFSETIAPPGKKITLAATPAQTLAAGQSNEEVAIADFIGDGIPDSATVTGRGIFVTLPRADGTAVSSTLYPIPADTGPSIVAVDFNRDGRPDLSITQGASATDAFPSPSGNVVILLGNGDGTFGPPRSFPIGTVVRLPTLLLETSMAMGSPAWRPPRSLSRSRAQLPSCLEKGMAASPRRSPMRGAGQHW